MPSHKVILQNLNRAIGVSHCSNFHRQHLGSVVVLGNKVISVGFNQLKTSPVQRKYNKFRLQGKESEFPPHIHNDTLHAEIDSLNKCSYMDVDWKNVIIYVGRVDKAGKPKLAKPCPACMEAIKERGIKRVYYTTEDGYGCVTL